MPSSRHAMITRSAISPRFATRIFLNIPRLDGEQALAVLHRLSVVHVDLHNLSVNVRVDLVHQLHRFDDAEDLSLLDDGADLGERRRTGLRRTIESADDR